MKKTIILLTLSLTLLAGITAQSFNEQFNGTLDAWTGNTTVYIINTANELQLMDTDGGTSYLSTPVSTADATTWEFLVRLEFAPSTSNQVKIYLNASAADLSGTLNGYFIQIGASGGDDALEFRRQNGTSSTLLLTGTAGSVATDPALARVRVIRDATGNWELLADYSGGTNLVSEGTTFDDTYTSGNFFGVHCKYTATRKENFFFDDIIIDPIVVSPPKIQSVTPISNTALDVRFSEPVALPSAEITANYSVSGIGNPANAQLDAADAALVHLTGFSPAFTNGQTYTLTVTGVKDLTGDTADDSEMFSFFITEPPAPYDILINEFMAAKNTDAASFQNSEYVELYNRSDKYINLNNIRYSAGNSPVALPTYVMTPQEYVILTQEEFFNFFSGTALFDINVSLTDGGDDIHLQDLNGQTIHRKIYTTTEVAKGISTELINPESYCLVANWRLSTNPLGGTPGRENTQYSPSPDQTGPQLICANADSESTLRLVFNEILNETATDAFNYTVNNNIGSSVNAQLTEVGDEVILSFNTTFEQDLIYDISVSNVYDCTGVNDIGTANTAQFSFSDVNIGDLIISEILYDAPEGGKDFIEIYNHSNKILPINGLQILEQEEDTFRTANINVRCPLLPQEYIAFSLDPRDTRMNYPLSPNPEGIHYTNLPAFDDGSIAYILGEELLGRDTLDKLIISKSYHNPLVDVTKGVSLERIDFNAPTQDPNNWQSAAEAVGWATPAYENSQRYTETGGSSDNCLTINEEVFSPDGDGYQDFLRMDYDLDAPGYIANIRIFDAKGRQVKQLTNNQFLQPRGFFRWDGDTDDGQKARIGIYIVWVELFDVNGNVTRCKQACVVAGQM